MKLFETALEKIGRIISRQYGVEVVCEGNMARTDGKTIYLPSIKDLKPELEREFHGFLDHEAAHIKFTTFPEVLKCINGFHKNLLNMVEDERIERLMAVEFPGAKENLNVINAKYGQMQRDNRPKAPRSHRIILSIREVMNGRDIFPFEDDIKELMGVLNPLCLKLNECKNTQELREVTEAITRLIDSHEQEKDEQEKDESNSEEQGNDEENSESESSDSSESGGENNEESNDGEGEEESEEEGEESETSGGESDDSDGESSEGGEESDESDSERDSEGSSEGEAEEGEGTDSSEEMSATESMSLELDDNPVKDFEAMFNEEISEHIQKDRVRSYIPATTKFDVVNDYTKDGSADRYAQIKNKVNSTVGGIRLELERTLKVQENARVTHEQERGDLSRKNLARMAGDKNYRKVFKKFKKNETNNVAVQILVDQSGSMAGAKMRMARETVVAMAEALNALQIPFEVLGFNSKGSYALRGYVSELEAKNPGSTARFFRKREILEMCIFKSFDSTRLFGIECLDARLENPDGEAVRFAARRLSQRKEKRKVMIVLSDGMPCCGDAHGQRDGLKILNEDLKETVRNLPKFGIEVVGFGIQTEAPRAFYPNAVVVNSLEDLPKKTMRELSKILTRGAV